MRVEHHRTAATPLTAEQRRLRIPELLWDIRALQGEHGDDDVGALPPPHHQRVLALAAEVAELLEQAEAEG
jgi:hypothetical protein